MMLLWREIHWLRPLMQQRVEGFLTRLASDVSIGPILFEARAEAGTVRYLLGGEPANLQQASTLLTSMVPGTTFTRDPEREEVERAGRLRISQRSLALTLHQDDNLLRSILAALAAAKRHDDVLVTQVVLAGATPPQTVSDHTPSPTASWWETVLHGEQKASTELRTSMRGKLSQYRFRAVVRIGVAAKTIERRKLLTYGVLSALRQMQSGSTTISLVREQPEHVGTGHVPVRRPLRLTPPETLGFLALPCGDGELPGLPPIHPRVLAPPTFFVPSEARQFAVTTAPGVDLPVSIGDDAAVRHVGVVSPTGTGKTTLLLHLAKPSIDAGDSVIVIDPQGGLANDILSIIPEHRMGDVVVLDPMDAKPVGIDLLHGNGIDPSIASDGALAVFKSLFPHSFGPRTSDTIHSSLLTLAMNEGTTLADLPRLLTDPQFRRPLVANIHDPELERFWAQYDALKPPQQATWVGPVTSRLRQFMLRPGLRAVLSQPHPRFEMNDVLTKPRILIVSLNQGILGQSATLLGSLVVSQLWHLILARSATPKEQRRFVKVILDEAQLFLHLDSDLGDALARSRSMNVGWCLAHQFRRQMPADLLAGIDANTLNKVVFALDDADAKTLAANDPVLEQHDFTDLPPYHVYANLLSQGRRTGWFSARTLPPPNAVSDPDAVRAESQARYGLIDPPAPATPKQSKPGDTDDTIGRRRKEPA